MSQIAFVDIDTQFDFIDPAGKLYAKGAEAIKPNLARLINLAEVQDIPLISSVDSHAPGDAEFSQFPPHCLAGTPGQEKLIETTTGREVFVPSTKTDDLPDPVSQHIVLEKQVFPVFGNANAEEVFKKTGAKTFYVFGVVTEVCVKAAALGLLERGYQVQLIEDAIWPLDKKGGDATIAELRAKGASTTKTQDVIASLTPKKKAGSR